jgi:acetolactate synthase I/III small subunit
MRHTISALVENQFGVLARVAGMFSGRGFNIDTLNVGPTHDPKFSRITVVVIANQTALDQALKQLERLINVIEVTHFHSALNFVARELVMVKVKADSRNRTEIVELADIFGGHIVDVSPESVMLECTANANKIANLMAMLAPYEIIDIARTGSVALARALQPGEDDAE